MIALLFHKKKTVHKHSVHDSTTKSNYFSPYLSNKALFNKTQNTLRSLFLCLSPTLLHLSLLLRSSATSGIWEVSAERGELSKAISGASTRLGLPPFANGILGNDSRVPPGRSRRVRLRPALLQLRPFHQSVSSDIGCYSNGLLLDDVGNRVSCTDESVNCPNPQR